MDPAQRSGALPRRIDATLSELIVLGLRWNVGNWCEATQALRHEIVT